MRTPGETAIHLTAALDPATSWEHPDDVAEARASGESCLFVRFFDGTQGVVDLARLIAAPDAGVFTALRDPDTFAAVHVAHGTVTWPGEIDLAPDAMYEALRKNGRWELS